MQFTTIAAATIIYFTTHAAAQSAYVENDCDFNVYVQYNGDGQPAGTPVQLAANSATSVSPSIYSAAIESPGAAILIGVTEQLTSPLTLEYTVSTNGSEINYDISDSAGNPFAAYNVTLIPSDNSCPYFDCAADSGDSCYSDDDAQVIMSDVCAYGTDLTVTVCAPSTNVSQN